MKGKKNRKEMKETYKCEVRREREGRKSRGRDEGELLSEEGGKEGRRRAAGQGSRMDGPGGQKEKSGVAAEGGGREARERKKGEATPWNEWR